MSSPYDHFDYPAYWKGRDYEHNSEILAIRCFIKKIPRIDNFLEIGSGYGRLSKAYLYRVKKVILSDPSLKLLSIAKKNIEDFCLKNVNLLQVNIKNLPKKIRPRSQDVVMMVRVLHHIKDIDMAFKNINKVLSERGYFILEFANKSHFKAVITEFVKGNFTFPLDIFSKDIRCKKSLKNKTLPFINYHPDTIYKKLEENGFEILETRSVSNLRNSFLKNYFPMETLLKFEAFFQTLFSKISFGPSIFVLSRKNVI